LALVPVSAGTLLFSFQRAKHPTVTTAVLFPRFDHPAVEERYASWHSEMLIRRQTAEFHYYDVAERASELAAEVHAEHVLVVTDPLVLVPPNLIARLAAALVDAEAAVPVANEGGNPAQKVTPPEPYMVLHELEDIMRAQQQQGTQVDRVEWDSSDPAVYLCKTRLLDSVKAPLRKALTGRRVAISRNDYIHRWSTMRGQVRQDLLDRIGPDARNVLEFGCGEGQLGAALKARQKCRVVGVELDPAAAGIARHKLDDVYCGDVREIVSLLHEQFD
jgi:methylase of polypeptide subunit release factors